VASGSQSLPQAPQFSRSVARLVQAKPQATSPAGHSQTPAVELPPEGQALPQVPQLVRLALRSAQTSPQLVVMHGW